MQQQVRIFSFPTSPPRADLPPFIAPRTMGKAAELTYYPSHLLPRPSSASSYAVGALDSRAFTATIDLGNDVCPTFETSATGPRTDYNIEVKIR